MLINVAPWMRPRQATDGDPRRVRFADAAVLWLCRVFALSLTSTVVLTAVGLAMDLGAWQCADDVCRGRHAYLRFMAAGFFAEPNRRLVIGALVPVVTIAVLWKLGHKTWKAYESAPTAGVGDGCSFQNPGFWNGKDLVGRLRTLHVTAAFSVLTASLTWPVLQQDRLLHSGGAVAGYALLGIAGLLLVLTVGLIALPRVVARDRPGGMLPLRVMSTVAMSSILGAVIYALVPRDWHPSGAMPGFSDTVTGFFAGQMLMLLLLALAIWVLRGST